MKFKNICKLLFFFYFFLIGDNLKAIENKILFKINDEIITSIDIFNEINYLKLINLNFSNLEINKMYEISKKSKIREIVKKKEILKYTDNLNLNKKILEDALSSIYSNLGLNSLDEFSAYLNNIGINLEFVENKISIELIWNDLILSKYKDKISIDTINLRKQLENETNEQEKLYLLSELIFNVENKSSLEKKINMIKKDIEEQGFSNAVLIHSISTNSINDGGKIGWVNENSLNFKMKSTLSKMLKGDYSEPIIVPGGFLILKIDDIKNIKNDKIDIDKKLNEIIISKTREQLDRYSNIYYNKVEKNFTINEI